MGAWPWWTGRRGHRIPRARPSSWAATRSTPTRCWGSRPAKVDLYEANLREPLVTPLSWSDERLEAIKERLRLSIRSMKAYLADPEANAAVIEDFERAEDLRICRWCNFRAVCRPELSGL